MWHFRYWVCLFGVLALNSIENALATPAEFTSARAAYDFQFPRDHGVHGQFESEWWYVTGNLYFDEAGVGVAPADLGFQLTFFRRASAAGASVQSWNQFFLAHAAVSDFSTQRYVTEKRRSAGALGVAGAEESRLAVWNGDWRLESFGDSFVLNYDVGEAETQYRIRLVLSKTQTPVIHGNEGYSIKGKCSTCASHYYSIPQLKIAGEIYVRGAWRRVFGRAWLDQEFMSRALDEKQIGWTWFGLNLQQGQSLMLYKLRAVSKDAEYAAGTFVRDGVVTPLATSDFNIEELAWWTSTATSGRYPVRWRIKIPRFGIELEVAARFEGQEQARSKELEISYWEGAVASSDHRVVGYAELTGYAEPLQQAF